MNWPWKRRTVSPAPSGLTAEFMLRLADRLAEQALTMGTWRQMAYEVHDIIRLLASGKTVQLLGQGTGWALDWLARAQKAGLLRRADGTYAGPPDGAGRLLRELAPKAGTDKGVARSS